MSHHLTCIVVVLIARLAGTKADASPLAQAFASLAAPFTALDIDEQRPRDIYGFDLLLLLRPDLHIVWRGDRLPYDPSKLAAIATGH